MKSLNTNEWHVAEHGLAENEQTRTSCWSTQGLGPPWLILPSHSASVSECYITNSVISYFSIR